ncbi:MAG: 4-(cytidine 5'-diphospho)-2-C-methyl-D-erythritol kinase, partial [Pseudomonadota bacterium]
MAGVSVRARAKLNLTLHVGAVQSDGYHPLDSYVAFADFGDEVAARPSEGLSLAIDGPFADALAGEPLETNLALRSARALEETARTLGRAPGGG